MAGKKTDATIAFSVTDNLSQTIVGMKNSVNSFKKDAAGLQKQLDLLDRTKFQLKNIDLKQAKNELKQAERAFKELGDAATEADRETAKANMEQATQNYENVRRQLAAVTKEARETEKAMLDVGSAASRSNNRAGSAGGGQAQSLGAALGKAGLGKMAGEAVMQISNTLIGSAFGSQTGSLLSSGLSGVVSGAAIGSIVPGLGTMLGGLVGGLTGLAQGKAQAFEAEDEAFKAYYQELYEAGEAKSAASLEAGTAAASQRELDAIAFNRLLGEGTGDKYLSDLRQLAASTPMEYGDLTQMSRALAVGFGDSPERMLSLMQSIGDAGSAVGVTAQDMSMMAQAMSRMQSSGKATLEYLNILQERGVNVIGMLADEYGKTQGEIYDLISKGEINGQSAVDIIERGMAEAYGGAMETMAQTYSGLSSTLSDTLTEIDNARGEGYTGGRKEGLAAEIDAYGGALGDAMESLYRIRGENEAYLENLEEQYKREALSAVLTGGETTLFEGEQKEDLDALRGDYVRASREYLEGNKDAGLKMENLAQQAEALATGAYQSSEQYKLVQQTELDQIAALRENTAALDGWRNAYNMQQAFTKGLAAVVSLKETSFADTGMYESASWGMHEYGRDSRTKSDFQSGAGERAAGFQRSAHAYGLRRVPYDGYAAILHQGERVLTAREARAQDSAPAGAVSVNISGQWSVRSDSDIDSIASALVQRIELAQRAGVRG